jgi:hypothetical protein
LSAHACQGFVGFGGNLADALGQDRSPAAIGVRFLPVCKTEMQISIPGEALSIVVEDLHSSRCCSWFWHPS